MIDGFRRDGVDVDEGHLAYQTGGAGDRAVVLLHGASLDNGSITWRRVAEDLAADHRVFSPDLPTHGDSWPWQARADQHALEDVLIRLLGHPDRAVVPDRNRRPYLVVTASPG